MVGPGVSHLSLDGTGAKTCEDWAVSVRLGVAQVRTRVTAGSGAIVGSDSQRKAKLYAGPGASDAISKTVKIELGVDSTQAEYAGAKGTPSLIGLGMGCEF